MMKRVCHAAVFNVKFRKICLSRFSCLFRCVPLPLRLRPPPDQLRLGNQNCNFSSDSRIEYENLLTRADVQEYLQFLNNECDKYLNSQKHSNEVLTYISDVKNCESYLKSLKTLTNNDKELDKLVKAEEEEYRNKIKHNYIKILSLAHPSDKNEVNKGAFIEVTPGVGGIEAKLFAEEVFEMYLKYVNFKGWNIEYVDKLCTESGGINKGEVCISGKCVFSFLKHEAGIHRVQRIPVTEKSGRMQTSTCRVHVLPDVGDSEIELKNSDLKIETKLSSGPGGQNVQKTETCVKVTHLPTGLTAESQRERYQKLNLIIALKKLKNLLYEREQEKHMLEESELKKRQAATVLRSDKIRTYNFSQNRVTDHRINHTAHNIKMFMEGTGLLDDMVCLLDATYKKETLLSNIARILKEKNVDKIFNR